MRKPNRIPPDESRCTAILRRQGLIGQRCKHSAHSGGVCSYHARCEGMITPGSMMARVAAVAPTDVGDDPLTASIVIERFGLSKTNAYQILSRLRQRGVLVEVRKRQYRKAI